MVSKKSAIFPIIGVFLIVILDTMDIGINMRPTNHTSNQFTWFEITMGVLI